MQSQKTANTTKPCPLCGQSFLSGNLARHVRAVHGTELRPDYKGRRYLCVPCNRSFSSSNRAAHMKNSHQGVQVECRPMDAEDDSGDNSDFDLDTSEDEDIDDEEMEHPDDTSRVMDDESMVDDIPERGIVSPRVAGDSYTLGDPFTSPTVVQSPIHAEGDSESLTPAEVAVMRYARHVSAVRAAVIDDIERLRQEATDLTGEKLSRFGEESDAYLGMLKKSSVGFYMTAPQYMELTGLMGNIQFDSDDECRNSIVICNSDEARDILENGSPVAPLLIRSGQASDAALTIEDYSAFLQTKTIIDVHVFDRDWTANRDQQPLAMKPSEAVAKFHDQSIWPINFINLQGFRQNPVPKCLEGIKHYTVLTSIREDHTPAGKRITELSTDLSAGAYFQLLAKKGAMHMPHRDADHVITTVEVDEGYKLWLMWPTLYPAELKDWAKRISEDILAAPTPDPIAILLCPGDILIQPARRVHAPYSITNVLMTGTKCWDAREVSKVPWAALEERHWPNIVNEDLAREMRRKLEHIEKLWGTGCNYWEFGSDFESFQDGLTKLYDRKTKFLMPMRG